MRSPYYGNRKIGEELTRQGHPTNRKRAQRLMRIKGLEAAYTKPRTTVVNPDHKVFLYLLRGVSASKCDRIWSTHITYIPMAQGFMYLVAVVDWYSRYVLSWRLSNTLDGAFCNEALDAALTLGRPEIFNTHQSCQFTSSKFSARLLDRGIAVSMDGRGQALDNIYIERIWRSLKYEDIHLNDYQSGQDLFRGMSRYIPFYQYERIHQSLDYLTPAAVYHRQSLPP